MKQNNLKDMKFLNFKKTLEIEVSIKHIDLTIILKKTNLHKEFSTDTS